MLVGGLTPSIFQLKRLSQIQNCLGAERFFLELPFCSDSEPAKLLFLLFVFVFLSEGVHMQLSYNITFGHKSSFALRVELSVGCSHGSASQDLSFEFYPSKNCGPLWKSGPLWLCLHYRGVC